METCESVFFLKEEDGIRDGTVTGVQTCALPISTGLGSVATAGTYTTTEGLSECVRRATKFHKKLQTQLMITNQLQRNMDLNLQITYGTFLKSIQNLEKHFNNFFAFRKTF